MVATMKESRKPISGVEKRDINMAVRRAVGLEILRGGSSQLRQLDEELMPTDRVMRRWAVSIGMGIPTDEWDERPTSRPPRLDDATAIVVDQTIMRGLPRYRRLVRTWYKTPTPSTSIAESLGVSRSGLYLEWRCSLFFYRGAFRDTGHADLIRMLEDFDPAY
jgi:hypothetical protein